MQVFVQAARVFLFRFAPFFIPPILDLFRVSGLVWGFGFAASPRRPSWVKPFGGAENG